MAYEIVSDSPTTQLLRYGDWYIDTDGELDFMRVFLQPHHVVFDVGANIGDWSLYALHVENTISLYSFEPLPAIFPDLKERLLKYPHAQAFNLALSNRNGKGAFCYYDETHQFSALSSFYLREVLKADHELPKIIEVDLTTLSCFCQDHNIEAIDFLKIDAEGAEWVILQGALSLIEANKIRAIQFEYGGCFVDAKTTLKAIFQLLSNHNYSIFRIMPNGLIHIPTWRPELENFELSNYVAIQDASFINQVPLSP